MNETLSSQKHRAQRIIALRKSLKLSRGDFAINLGIAKGTLQHWENINDKSGLTPKGAERLRNALDNYGVQVSSAWLLFGEGDKPMSLNGVALNQSAKLELIGCIKEKEYIEAELNLFLQHYKHSVSLQVNDDKMQPLYAKGDVLAGVKLFGEAIRNTVNKVCIVMTQESNLLLRIVKESNVPGQYSLTHLNHNHQPVITALSFAAPIAFVRKCVKFKTTSLNN